MSAAAVVLCGCDVTVLGGGAPAEHCAAPLAKGRGGLRVAVTDPQVASAGTTERLTGAYGVGPAAGEWMQQIILAVRARLEIVRDTIQPFPSFSAIVAAAAEALRDTIAASSAGEPAASAGGSR